MSPQHQPSPVLSPTSRLALTKARKMQQEDPRFRDFDRMLARAFVELQKRRIRREKAGVYAPRMDLCDDPENPSITAMLELPGMKPEHLSVRIEEGQLVIEGERMGPSLHIRNQPPPPQSIGSASPSPSAPTIEAVAVPDTPNTTSVELYPVRELKYGKFCRRIPLPAGVMASQVRSTLIEGMLTISWPRDPASPSGPVSTGSPSLVTHHHISNTNASV